MAASDTFQLELEAAEFYEEKFVPALFAEWARLLVEEADVRPGQRVLDVACGTGIVARTAAERAGEEMVAGLDLNEAMLSVARRVRPGIRWLQGDAASLPFPDRGFDVVLCQMALMFFPDPVAALGEMRRVADDAGTVAVVVPGRLDDQPAYGPFVQLAVRCAGEQAAELLGTYWACGDAGRLGALTEAAGLRVRSLRPYLATAGYGSPEDFVRVEVEGTPLARQLSARQYALIRAGVRDVLAPYLRPDGSVGVPLQGHILVASPAVGGTG
ncbi:class I SAM-dependent methyltransferase [Arthrobacter mobilis]|uniref:Methyltransferase domain-containing protein n=1 Tax=Arthrobacter mobilis TaxID=2724944 RepID=A0A7X6HBW7_9MICC|nr:methyltransferase domain-containing protein [Arthrobacter mobilis]NKX53298.1 methyltransferase domain-containing protein [Arthrobacter mobilis]